jgi:hypothetical protein
LFRFHLSRPGLTKTLLCFSLLYCAQSFGVAQISGLDPIQINAWAGTSSDLTGSDTFCTLSCTGACNRANRRRNYDSAAYTNGVTDGAGNFYITNGAHSMMVFFDWTHPVSGTTRMTNYNVTGTPTPVSAGAYSCTADRNSQTRVDITLPAGQLATARAGTYSETFAMDVCRISGGGYAECSAQVNFSVTLPELIQITNLDDVNLGTWSGSGDMQITEDFCVFRNGQGGFSITTNGSNDAGGNFNLRSTANLPYTIEYSQGGAFLAASPGTAVPFASSGFTGDSVRDCAVSGGTNTSIRFTVSESELNSKTSGTFSDTIDIFVIPD